MRSLHYEVKGTLNFSPGLLFERGSPVPRRPWLRLAPKSAQSSQKMNTCSQSSWQLISGVQSGNEELHVGMGSRQPHGCWAGRREGRHVLKILKACHICVVCSVKINVCGQLSLIRETDGRLLRGRVSDSDMGNEALHFRLFFGWGEPPINGLPLELGNRGPQNRTELKFGDVYGLVHGRFVRKTCFPSELVSSHGYTKMHSIVAEWSPAGSLGKDIRSNMVHYAKRAPEDDFLICGPSLASIPGGNLRETIMQIHRCMPRPNNWTAASKYFKMPFCLPLIAFRPQCEETGQEHVSVAWIACMSTASKQSNEKRELYSKSQGTVWVRKQT